MRYKGLDLNLLSALDILLELRNVSRASERMSLSQSALSAALARLREYFDDDLLVVVGRRMHPTPFAEQLLPSLRACLAATDTLLQTSRIFDPASAHRTFKIVSSDYAHTALLVDLSRKFATTAPDVRLEFFLPGQSSTEALMRGEMDILVGPQVYMVGPHPAESLFDESFVVVGCKTNPIFGKRLQRAAVFDAGHIAVSIGSDRRTSFADLQLEALMPDRRIVAVASSFTMVARMVLDTRYIALMHRRLAQVMARQLPIAFDDPPFSFPVMREMVQHHRTRANDMGLRWLIDEIRATAREQTDGTR